MAKLVIGQEAPIFSLKDINGREIALEDFLERTVLINFWSAECPWAERADRVLAEWQDRVVLLSIASNANEPLDLLRVAAMNRGLQVVLRDSDHKVADLYEAVTTPHLFLIDGGGILRYQGAFDDVNFRQREPTRNYVEEALRALLKGEQIAVTETLAYGCTIVREMVN